MTFSGWFVLNLKRGTDVREAGPGLQGAPHRMAMRRSGHSVLGSDTQLCRSEEWVLSVLPGNQDAS